MRPSTGLGVTPIPEVALRFSNGTVWSATPETTCDMAGRGPTTGTVQASVNMANISYGDEPHGLGTSGGDTPFNGDTCRLKRSTSNYTQVPSEDDTECSLHDGVTVPTPLSAEAQGTQPGTKGPQGVKSVQALTSQHDAEAGSPSRLKIAQWTSRAKLKKRTMKRAREIRASAYKGCFRQGPQQ